MTHLLQNAAYGTALILAAAVLRRTLRDRLVPEARLALWAVCLFRLLTPAAPESVLSLWGLFAKPAPVQTPQLYIPAPSLSAPAPQPAAPAFSWEMALAAAWLAVGGVLAVRYALSWGRTRRAVASTIPLGRDDPRYTPLPKCARLREGVMEGAPLTFGVARPTVVLSPGLDGEAGLRPGPRGGPRRPAGQSVALCHGAGPGGTLVESGGVAHVAPSAAGHRAGL